MPHVVTRPNEPFLTRDGLLIHQIPSWQDNLIWLAVCTQTGEAAVVDGPEAETSLDYCQEHGIRLTTIFNTHTHADHIGINRDLDRRGLLSQLEVWGSAKVRGDVPGLTRAVDEGDPVQLGAVTGRVMRTEGHINGHISYVFDDVVFCGDTLFTGGCGYLFDGPPSAMYDSLQRLAALGDAIRVCCGHEYTQDNLRFAWSLEPGNEALAQRIQSVWAIRADGGCTVPSTMVEERRTNPFLRQDSPELVAQLQEAWPGRHLNSPLEIFTATRELKNRKVYRAISDEELPIG